MTQFLHIDSSILGGNSVSHQLTAQIAASWRAAHPATEVSYLDLAVDTPSHLSAESLGFRVTQVGRTFKYTEKGPIGLAGGKTVIVASTRGGVYSTSDAGNAMEHQESFLKTVFGFLGVTDVRFVRAEGLAMGEAAKAAALAAAQADTVAHTQSAANQPEAALAA